MSISKQRYSYKWLILLILFVFGNSMFANKEQLLSQHETNYLDSICRNYENCRFRDWSKLTTISELLLQEKYSSNVLYVAFGNYSLGDRAYYQQDYRLAQKYFLEALSNFKQIDDTIRIANTLNAIGVVNYILCNDDISISAYLEAFKYFNAYESEMGMAQMFHNIALIYIRSNNFDKSDYYALKAIKIYKQIDEFELLADLYNSYGVSLLKRKKYNESRYYFNQSLLLYDKINFQHQRNSVIFNIATIFENKNNFDSAFVYYNRSHQAFAEMKDTINLIGSYQKLATCADYRGETDTALEMLLTAEILNKKIGDKEADAIINYRLSEVYEKLYRFQDALKRYKLFTVFTDSIKNKESLTRIAEIESKFLVEQTQKELILSEQQSSIKTYAILIIVLLFIFIGITLFFYWHHHKIKEEKRALMLEHKVLRTQMDPHFIFNSLSALQCYIMEDKPKDAISFLSDFSALLRLVLQYSKSELVLISKEKMILDYYLALQNRRFDNKIDFKIEIDEELLTEEVLIPPMLAQPFIENSLVHGGLESIENAKIIVTFIKINNYIKLIIEDNGIGIEKSLREFKKDIKHESLAILITQERLKLINSKQKEKVDLMITDLSKVGLRGTRVEFMIPIKI